MQIAETDQPTHIMALVSDQRQSRLHFLQARQEYAQKRLGRKGSRFFEDWAVITGKIYVGYDNTKQSYPPAVMQNFLVYMD